MDTSYSPNLNDDTKVSKVLRRSVATYIALIGVFLLAVVVAYFVVADAVNKTIESQAVTVAEIVASHATSARSVYAFNVAEKLKHDGFGPHVNYGQMPGYVPIPAEFLKMIGEASAANTADLFHYKPVSKWNLEPSQGINDDFLHWAWPQLEKQDLPNPAGPISWKPVWRFDLVDGEKVLHYLAADAASQMSCVACHNAYEAKPEIIARRKASGNAPGKQWQLHQLMGALAVTIPLDKVEKVASIQKQTTTLLIFVILLTSFLVMIWFNSRLQNQQRSLSNLSWQATHDPLTKFLNRRGFDVEIKRFFEIAKTTNTQHVVLIIDIDNFKGINDTYGHSAGDELLKQLGVNLPALVHTDDVIARLGGDEFALLLRDCNEEEGRTIAENIRQKIFGSGIEFDGKHIPATASIGAAVMSSANASTREVLTDADIACYISKRGGRNQVHVYHQNDSKLSE